MAWWMTPPPDSDRWVHVRGAAVILLVLAVLVGVFWIIDANVDVAPITEL
jgi:hypothetical protein